MIDPTNIRGAMESVYENNTALDMLIDFEGVLDNVHIYAYKNWSKGEVVQGPDISKYWVEVTLMYNAKQMPDPEGAMRIISKGGYVSFKKDTYIEPVRVIKHSDTEVVDGEIKAKKVEHAVWLVRISIPRTLLDDLNTERMSVNGVEIDMTDVTDAYDENLDDSLSGEELGDGDDE